MALTAGINYQTSPGTTRRLTGKSTANTTFYKGALLAFNASGLLVKAADTANFKSAGMSTKDQVVPSTSTDVEYETGVLRIPFSSAQQSDVGKLVYPTADDTIALTATNISPIGVVEDWETGYLWVNTNRRSL